MPPECDRSSPPDDLAVKPVQHRLHGYAQVDENPDKAARPCQVYRLLQHGISLAGLPLGIQRQGAQCQDLDLVAQIMGSVGNLIQFIQYLLVPGCRSESVPLATRTRTRVTCGSSSHIKRLVRRRIG